jgi:cytochrome c-type protein NapB
MWGKKAKGAPTPMPPSHYTDMRNAPGTVAGKLIGSRYVCTQCHAPQASVKPLVGKTF